MYCSFAFYCYANYSQKRIDANVKLHDPDSPLLIGHVGPEDRITERKMSSCMVRQLSLDV